MRRKYLIEDYLEVLSMIQSYFPNAAFGADIIVGYPDETEDDFQETRSFLEKSPLTHFHVFPFSKRKLTQAAKRPGQLTWEIKNQRSKDLIDLGNQKLKIFSSKILNSVEEVLFESGFHDGYTEGYTRSFVKVKVKSQGNLANELLNVRLNEIKGDQLYGHLLN